MAARVRPVPIVSCLWGNEICEHDTSAHYYMGPFDKSMYEQGSIYIEAQVSNLCAVHAINNLLGAHIISRKHMFRACEAMYESEIDTHDEPPLCTRDGDFRVEVVLKVLDSLRGIKLHAKTLPLSRSACESDRVFLGRIEEFQHNTQLLGFVVHVAPDHWVAFRRHRMRWIWIDSINSQATASRLGHSASEFLRRYNLAPSIFHMIPVYCADHFYAL
jgi:hypothetical protein